MIDRGLGAYKKTQVTTTVNQQELIVLAYDGVIRFLNEGKAAIAKREIESAHNALVRARDIVEELAGTLNMDQGGEIARNLWSLYVFFMQKITEANLTKNSAHVDAILPALADLREAWVGLKLPKDDAKIQSLNRHAPTNDTPSRLSISG